MSVPWRLVVVHAARHEPRTVEDLVRVAVDELGVALGSARVRHHCPSCGSSDHGRPWLEVLPGEPQVHLGVARCPGRTVVALSVAGPVGVDVEPSGSAEDGDVEEVLGAGPGDATHRWVRTEALLKAAGYGFGRPGTVPAAAVPRWESDLDLGESFEAAVAVMTVDVTGPELLVIQAAVEASSG